MRDLFDNTRIMIKEPKGIKLRVNDTDVSYNISENIITKYKDACLKNQSRVLAVIKQYIARNSSKLGVRAPTTRIPFTDYDKDTLFKAAGVDKADVQASINSINKNDIDLRNKVINDPFNVLCTILTSIYYCADKHRDDAKKDFTKPYYYTSLYLAIRFYGKLYIRQFKYDPSEEVMDYTIENVSNKFLLKKTNNVFDLIKYFSESNIENMAWRLERAADIDIVYYSTNMCNRMSNSIKTLGQEFYKNKELMNKTKTDSASMTDEEGEFYVGDLTNISASLDTAVRKIILKFVSDTVIDNTILDAACSKTKFSKAKMLLIVQNIREANDPILKKILVDIISYYLIQTKKPISAIRSSDFVMTMIKLYGVSNTKNDAIINLKQELNDLIVKSSKAILTEGNSNMVDRVKNSLYVYLVLFIAKNIE